MRSGILVAAAAFLAMGPATAMATTIYSNDFESGSLAGFTLSSPWYMGVDTAPNGQKFLGGLSYGYSAALTVDNTGYDEVTLSFDLYTINSLDGDGVGPNCCGPDNFDLNINGQTSLIHASFANEPWWTQSYGGPGALAGTGSDMSLLGQLGYCFYGPDHTYHFTFTAFVSAAQTVFNFIGNTDQGWSDEGYGIDNIVVTALDCVPEPGTWSMMLVGVAAIGGALRLQRRQRSSAAAA
jgi:hypothetical protein